MEEAAQNNFKGSGIFQRVFFPNQDVNNRLTMKWTLIEYYDLSLAISQFGGSYKSLSLLFSLFFVPVLIWQFRRDTARIIMKDENISMLQAT
jgi:hypothetical protein